MLGFCLDEADGPRLEFYLKQAHEQPSRRDDQVEPPATEPPAWADSFFGSA